ncbi:lipoyl(octanoyl) transferase LipB [Blattabacterium cuenoti]|uniref:lipoyl(octanoyl) transferase LipB n=1 Tax=Blattabacterium cuenoti TaxID=1653831 RepID=UPI00163BE850|nr:lipoyl(octanoyl) transferase LipB [Blattabacterium cuenoti]
MKKKVIYFEYIKEKDYRYTWQYQKKIFNKIIEKKITNDINFIKTTNNVGFLLFVEYNKHIYTIGKNGKEKKNLLVTSNFLKEKNATLYKVDRGGDITYHGPGQLVIYPIIDLNYFFMDIHKYVRYLEEVIIESLNIGYNIKGIRENGKTGIWINKKGEPRKICSIGIKVSRWVTMHGLAFNINTDLQYFEYIIPCGIHNRKMTSLKNELQLKNTNESLLFYEASQIIKKSFKNIFQIELME